MAKNAVSDWSATPGNNTDIGGISIAENATPPSNVNNAMRTIMAQIKAGVPYLSGTTTVFPTGDGASLTSTDAGATAGPLLDLFRDSASPAANDFIGALTISGRSSTGVLRQYGGVSGKIISTTNGTESGQLFLTGRLLGSLINFLALGVNNLTAFGAGSSVGLTQGQLSFPATQNPSSDANTLDDYEEGTWTPGLTFNGSATGVTYSVQTGTYVKNGQTVFVQGRIILTNNGSGTGAAALTGLPFTAANTTYNALPFGFWSGFASVVGNPVVLVDNNGTGGTLYMSGSGNAVAMTDSNITNAGDMAFSGTYRAAT